jgi:hypothetical protein
MKVRLIALAVAATLAVPATALDLGDLLNAVKGTQDKPSSSLASPTQSAIDALTPSEMSAGLKEALSRGAEAAVAQLGRQDGFYGDARLRIPLPENLKKADKLMRTFGMGKQADELVLAMNRAAEAAVPEAKMLLVNAVKDMSVEDAKGILTGGNEAATEFFRKKTETALSEKFLPMVKTATDQVGLAQTYNKYAGLASRFSMVKQDQASIENYVTKQSLDRLYTVIGEQERAIRTNPVQYGSDLLKKVFGALTGK